MPARYQVRRDACWMADREIGVPGGRMAAKRQTGMSVLPERCYQNGVRMGARHSSVFVLGNAAAERTRTVGLSRLGTRRRFRQPQINHRKYSAVQAPRRNVDLPPYRRSIDITGTSPSCQPASCAFMAISNVTAQPTGLASRCKVVNRERRNSLMPVVASLSTHPDRR